MYSIKMEKMVKEMGLTELTPEVDIKEKEINIVEKDFKKITLSPIQKGMIDQAAQLYEKYLPIPLRAIRGFISLAIRDYQVQNKIDLASYLEWSPEEQVKIAWGIANSFKERLCKILVDKKQEPLLDKVIKEAVNQSFKPPQ